MRLKPLQQLGLEIVFFGILDRDAALVVNERREQFEFVIREYHSRLIPHRALKDASITFVTAEFLLRPHDLPG
jgi:hypothetical protein